MIFIVIWNGLIWQVSLKNLTRNELRDLGTSQKMGNPRITAESLGDCTVSCRFRLKAHDDLDVQPFTGPSEDEWLQSDQLIEVLMIKIYEDLHTHTSEKSYPKRVLATAQVAQGKMHGEGLLRYSNGHLDSTQKLRWIIPQDLPTKSNQYTEFIIDWNSHVLNACAFCLIHVEFAGKLMVDPRQPPTPPDLWKMYHRRLVIP